MAQRFASMRTVMSLLVPFLAHIYCVLFDAHHEKTDLKVFVIVIPKEGWWPLPSFFWHDTNFLEFESFDFIDF